MSAEPQLPDVPPDDLPGGQSVDPHTFLSISDSIAQALEDGRAVHLNDLQLDILIAYARHCLRQKVSMLPNLAAGALHAFRTRGAAPENQELFRKLENNEVVKGLEERFRVKLKATVENTRAQGAGTEKGAEEDVPKGRNQIQEMQEALRVGNYDHAVDTAELALGRHGGPTPEIIASAALSFHMRAAKGKKELQSKLADIDRAIDLFREFKLLARDKEQLTGTLVQVSKRLEIALEQREQILKRGK